MSNSGLRLKELTLFLQITNDTQTLKKDLGTTVTETFAHATFVLVIIVPIQNAFYCQTYRPLG